MKVNELIKYLETLDGEMEVKVVREHMEYGRHLQNAYINISSVAEEKRYCRDAFDGTSYTKTVLIEQTDGEQKVLVIK